MDGHTLNQLEAFDILQIDLVNMSSCNNSDTESIEEIEINHVTAALMDLVQGNGADGVVSDAAGAGPAGAAEAAGVSQSVAYGPEPAVVTPAVQSACDAACSCHVEVDPNFVTPDRPTSGYRERSLSPPPRDQPRARGRPVGSRDRAPRQRRNLRHPVFSMRVEPAPSSSSGSDARPPVIDVTDSTEAADTGERNIAHFDNPIPISSRNPSILLRNFDVNGLVAPYAVQIDGLPLSQIIPGHERAVFTLSQIGRIIGHYFSMLLRDVEAHVALEEARRIVEMYNRPHVIDFFDVLRRTRSDARCVQLFNLHGYMKSFFIRAVSTMNREFIMSQPPIREQINRFRRRREQENHRNGSNQ